METMNQGMPCPVCRSQLVAMERQGVEIDHCPNCRGVWLDRGELDKILERSASQAQAWRPAAPQPQPQPVGRGYDDRRHDGDPHGHPKPHRRKSFFEELFD
ncbi:zf-TFIIB domain-containing protein [Sphingomonas sp. JC676]|uniref:TFIIB-type zinc ribbon-containing protein n=1 Tax=Sphingomonas sp. JC676 TaxID=2768065 RepID=UPI001657EAB2|nr:zf-TFIIB domain-containing protein [Sphingomonas sp. JC676]MBC9031671.1 zf-TFIIB domain-containing protein [Sphingomonas sp. JC676]